MAAAHQTLTITSSKHEILRLTPAPPGSLELAEELSLEWGNTGMGRAGSMSLQGETIGHNMEMEMGMGMEMNMGMGMGAPTMDGFNPDMNFEGDGLMDGMPSLPFTPSYDLDTFSSTFEDPFSYQSDAFTHINPDAVDPSAPGPTSNPSEPTNENPDNKLLSFGPLIPKCTLLSANAAQTWPSMTAELYGMFFVAEDVFGDTVPPAGRPMELTCYRRNLFQISGNITMSRGVKSILNEQGIQLPLYDLSATISAVESMEGKATEIISVPWKTASQATPNAPLDDKSGALPPKWPLDLSMNSELDPAIVSIPIAWKRLQFKHATANNGRRKGLQQHYVIQINLMGIVGNGETVKLAEIQSGPIIVRGRSPRNFDSRKDVNLTGERKAEGKPRTTSDAASKEPPLKVDPGVSNGSYKFYALNALQPLDLPDWNAASTPTLSSPSIPLAADSHRAKKPSLSHSSLSNTTNTTRPPVPKAKWKSDSTLTKSSSNTAPIDLSITDDDYGRASSIMSGSRSLSTGDRSPRLERVGSGGSGKKTLVGSPIENADLLYEYFPLSLDDWMAPVDAIYRPHVVHHTIMPPEVKAEQVKSKSKRYFSAED